MKEDTARELNLGRFLNRLDDEWKSIYCKRYGGRVSRREYRESYDRPEQRRPYPGSARTRYELDEDEEMDEEDESSPIILIIAAVVALLVGVAISLVLCLLVPDKITMAISIGLILVCLLYTSFSYICDRLQKRTFRKRDHGTCVTGTVSYKCILWNCHSEMELGLYKCRVHFTASE